MAIRTIWWVSRKKISMWTEMSECSSDRTILTSDLPKRTQLWIINWTNWRTKWMNNLVGIRVIWSLLYNKVVVQKEYRNGVIINNEITALTIMIRVHGPTFNRYRPRWPPRTDIARGRVLEIVISQANYKLVACPLTITETWGVCQEYSQFRFN